MDKDKIELLKTIYWILDFHGGYEENKTKVVGWLNELGYELIDEGIRSQGWEKKDV